MLKVMPINIMRRTLFILFLMELAGCSSHGAGTLAEPVIEDGVVKINSYKYKVSATGTKDSPTGLEDAVQQVYLQANAFCAKQERVAETVSLARLEEDYSRPASATLDFRCVKSGQPEPPHNPQS
jgi:hypothetical protein